MYRAPPGPRSLFIKEIAVMGRRATGRLPACASGQSERGRGLPAPAPIVEHPPDGQVRVPGPRLGREAALGQPGLEPGLEPPRGERALRDSHPEDARPLEPREGAEAMQSQREGLDPAAAAVSSAAERVGQALLALLAQEAEREVEIVVAEPRPPRGSAGAGAPPRRSPRRAPRRLRRIAMKARGIRPGARAGACRARPGPTATSPPRARPRSGTGGPRPPRGTPPRRTPCPRASPASRRRVPRCR